MLVEDTAADHISDPAQWVDLYGDQLYCYALRILRDPEAAEDVVQETFLGALRKKKDFQGRSLEKTWLFGILKHKITDHLRKRKPQTELDDQAVADEETKTFFNDKGHWQIPVGKWNSQPEDLLERSRFIEILRSCLEALPLELNKTFNLREMQGIPSKDICDILGITQNNLWIRMYRARMKIRDCLDKNWFTRN